MDDFPFRANIFFAIEVRAGACLEKARENSSPHRVAVVLVSIAVVSLTIGWRPFPGPKVLPLTSAKFEATPAVAASPIPCSSDSPEARSAGGSGGTEGRWAVVQYAGSAGAHRLAKLDA